ncbi:hypothetical protein IC614_05330 [Allosphingosinicella flava]|uniref:5-bromo-4-chloroindolyl phosphate hydrolysis protein n=1 Tax=Allosphingosinicella flava TaxID=2771430 RepID=A0A7T2LNB1_9SPHN|nr:hypothetical protein [Sphingosinicella flava]QPQ56002.1 hypothetical protein IC614_05330 [Sphingosinicella flava]
MIGLGEAFDAAETFLRKHIKSKAVRAAEKRRKERKRHEAARKFGRAATATAVSGGSIAAYSLAVAPLATPLLLAGGVATVGLAVLAARWQGRTLKGFSREELTALPGKAESWLLDLRERMPREAGDPLDRVLSRLGDLQPQLGEIDPNSTLAWDARRLIGDHLPRLVRSYCELPAHARAEDPSFAYRLAQGLDTLADELGDLCTQVSRDRRLTFEAHQRFIQSRYRDDIKAE